jgi:glyoxylase-like metal-dependent hydrolase (beta-lactamase superfamily II)
LEGCCGDRSQPIALMPFLKCIFCRHVKPAHHQRGLQSNALVHAAKLYTQQVQIVQFPVLDDNYGLLIHDGATGATATIDSPDAQAIMDQCTQQGWTLSHILNTHHHADHAGGNLELKELTGCSCSCCDA